MQTGPVGCFREFRVNRAGPRFRCRESRAFVKRQTDLSKIIAGLTCAASVSIRDTKQSFCQNRCYNRVNKKTGKCKQFLFAICTCLILVLCSQDT